MPDIQVMVSLTDNEVHVVRMKLAKIDIIDEDRLNELIDYINSKLTESYNLGKQYDKTM